MIFVRWLPLEFPILFFPSILGFKKDEFPRNLQFSLRFDFAYSLRSRGSIRCSYTFSVGTDSFAGRQLTLPKKIRAIVPLVSYNRSLCRVARYLSFARLVLERGEKSWNLAEKSSRNRTLYCMLEFVIVDLKIKKAITQWLRYFTN